MSSWPHHVSHSAGNLVPVLTGVYGERGEGDGKGRVKQGKERLEGGREGRVREKQRKKG